MTATDVLRRLLDERGVEYEGGKRSLRWRDRNGVMMQAFPLANGELGMGVWSCTPEQAIAATLGVESDTVEYEHNTDGSYKCPKCGCVVDYDIRGDDERIITMDDYVIPFNFCPKCGAEVVEE